MSQSNLKQLYQEREKILGDLTNRKNRAKLLVRLMDIDDELEKFAQLTRKDLKVLKKY